MNLIAYLTRVKIIKNGPLMMNRNSFVFLYAIAILSNAIAIISFYFSIGFSKREINVLSLSIPSIAYLLNFDPSL